jgi:hypothetical protein
MDIIKEKIKNNKCGYIYLLKMFDDDGCVVYKIGRCEDFESRMKGYKFKKIIYTIATDDCYKLENDLKSIIKNKYLITTGTEYFKCDDEIELIHLIVNISLPKKKTIEDDILSIINENKINELKNEMTKKLNDEINELKNIHYNEIKKLNIINKDIETKMLDFYNKMKELENKNIQFIQNINETYGIENEKILMKNEDINVNNINVNNINDGNIFNNEFNKYFSITNNQNDIISKYEIINLLNNYEWSYILEKIKLKGIKFYSSLRCKMNGIYKGQRGLLEGLIKVKEKIPDPILDNEIEFFFKETYRLANEDELIEIKESKKTSKIKIEDIRNLYVEIYDKDI